MAKYINKVFNKETFRKDSKGIIYFNKIIIKDITPNIYEIENKEFIEVIYNGKAYWAIFKCPCGCKNVISLTLQNTHSPYWSVTKSVNGRPTLYPSVWQNKGCYSHFWIEDGKVFWCENSGIEPCKAEPLYYKNNQVKRNKF